MSTALGSRIRLSPGSYVSLNELYPAGGWVSGYAQYRYRAYLFAPPGSEAEVAQAGIDVLDAHGIGVSPMAVEMAKQDPNDFGGFAPSPTAIDA